MNYQTYIKYQLHNFYQLYIFVGVESNRRSKAHITYSSVSFLQHIIYDVFLTKSHVRANRSISTKWLCKFKQQKEIINNLNNFKPQK